MGEVLDVLGKMQCNIVCKGERYYLPILVGDYMMENLPYFVKNGYGFC